MGPRQLVIVLLSIMVFPGCFLNRKMCISNCNFAENSLIIELETKNMPSFKVNDVSISYKNVPLNLWFSEGGGLTYYKTDSRIILYLDLTDKVLCTNEEAEFGIGISGGGVYGYITIKDTTSNSATNYTFPNEASNNLSISILDQWYGVYN